MFEERAKEKMEIHRPPHYEQRIKQNDCRTALTWTPRRVTKTEQTKDNMEKHDREGKKKSWIMEELE